MRKRLMCVLAHPDDESLGTGGTLAKYAAEGVETYLVTATRGERGRFGDGGERPATEWSAGRERRSSAPRRRSSACARSSCSGIPTVGSMPSIPRDRAGGDRGQLRRIRPHVVITFGPEGAYGHPDHIAISQFTTAAVVRGGRSRLRGLEAVSHRLERADLGRLSVGAQEVDQHRRRRRAAGDPGAGLGDHHENRHERGVANRVARGAVPSDADEHLREPGGAAPEHHRALWGVQEFYRAFSLVNGGRTRESDLFEGLR